MSEISAKDTALMDFEFSIVRDKPIHFHQTIELLYVLEGHLKLKVEEERYQLGQDDMIVINMNRKHEYHGSDDILLGHIYFSPQQLSELIGQDMVLFWCNSVVDKSEAYKDVRIVVKQIFNQSFEQTGQGKLYLTSLYYQLLHVLTSNFLVRSHDQRFNQIKSQYDERIQKILTYIHANYKKQISLNDLSKKLYLSNAYLSKYIKKQLGMTFVEYLNNIRLHHAVSELLYTEHSMVRIALDNGFPNTAAFNKVFRETYHMTPSAYQAEKKNKVVIQDNRDQEALIKEKLDAYFEKNPMETVHAGSQYDDYVIADCRNGESFLKSWNRMINIGRAKDLMRSDVQSHIIQLHERLGFEYVRFWSVLSEEVYIDYNNSRGQYNFDMLDRGLDFLAEHRLKPYLELGFKRDRLILSSDAFFKDKGFAAEEEKSFESPETAFRFMTSFIAHLVNRYGLEEVESWYFELWKPEEEFSRESAEINSSYYRIFDSIYSAVKQFSLKIKVGGAGLSIRFGQKNFRDMLSGWKQQRCQPDFLSLYCYPYVPGEYEGVQFAKFSTDKSHMKNQLEMARRIMEDIGFTVPELHVTEWNSTVLNRNCLNDSCYKGAYMMKNLIDCIGYADCIGYWTGSDILADYYDSRFLLNGGCGLMTKDGIAKPAFYAVEFLNKLGNLLLEKGDNYIVTDCRHNNYAIACHNYKHFNYKYYLMREDEVEIKTQNRLFENNEAVQLKFQLKHVANGTYSVKTYSVNENQGSVQNEWLRMNLTANTGKEEIQYLRQICTPRLSMKEYKVEDKVLNLETVLLPNEIQYIYISNIYQ